MTIKFNANTTSSYYAGTGWEAKVNPFINHNMELKDVVAFQDNTGDVKPNSTNQEIIGLELDVEGTMTTANLEEVKIDVKQSLASISKVSLLYSVDNKDFAVASEVASVVNPTTQDVTLTLATPQALTEGKVYLWIAYDTKADIESDEQLDAKVVSVKVAGVETTPSIGDPEGHRLTKNTIELAAGDNGTVKLTKAQMFYDDGGAANDYTPVFDGQITFTPANVGEVVMLDFKEFRTHMSAHLKIYSGTQIDESKLIQDVSGTSFPKEPIISRIEDGGAMTIHFSSTGTSTFKGWEIEASSYVLRDLFIEGLETTMLGDANIMRAAEQSPVQQIKLKVTGDKNKLSLNDFKFSLAGTTAASDLVKANLYYTGSSASILPQHKVGADATGTNLVFTNATDVEINESGEYYFWLAYDVSATATVGNTLEAKLESIKSNGTDFATVTETLAVSKTVKAGLKGTYTIGASASTDYKTIKDATDALKTGVEGAVIFNIEAGTYNENVLIEKVSGTSANSTITFTSATGNKSDVVIEGSRYSEPPYGEEKYGVWTIDNTSHVILKDLTFAPTDKTYPALIYIRKESRYITVKDNSLTSAILGSETRGMNMIYTTAENIEGKNNDYLTVEGNTITGGYISVYVNGTSFIALTKQVGAVVRNNTIINPSSKGVYISDERNALIEGNTITSTTTQKRDFQAMDIFRCKDNLIVRNNKIFNDLTLYSIGINIRKEVEGAAATPAMIYNNSISIVNAPTTTTYGILMTGDTKNVNFYHNTIRISGTAGYAFGSTGKDEVVENVNVKNNLFQSFTPSGLLNFIRQPQLTPIVFANNAYHMTSGDFAGSWAADLDAWKTLTNETTAIEHEAEFFTESDLHLKAEGPLNAGTPLAEVTTDLEGSVRSTTVPTIGAYEFKTVVVEVPEMETGYPNVQKIEHNKIVLNVKYSQTGTLYYILKPAADAAPTVAELKAASTMSVDGGSEKGVTFSGLTEKTKYKAYFYVESVFGEVSVITASDEVTTLVQIFPIKVTLPRDWGASVAVGTDVKMYPIVEKGVYPYAYEWRNAMNEVISTDSICTINAKQVGLYTLNVKDAGVENQTYRTSVYVNSKHKVATFDDFYLETESYWQGVDDGETMESVFYSGTYSFTNMYIPDMYTWGAFAVSNLTATDFDPGQFLTQQFRSSTGEGVDGSANYSVAYPFGARSEIRPMNDMVNGQEVAGIYLTNAAYTLSSIKNGDSFVGDPFQEGDWYKIIFKGHAADGSTKEVECYLADYRSTNAAEHYALDTWEWFDLSSLGKVKKISVRVDGSRKNEYGLTTPAYFCMDNLGAAKSEPEPEVGDLFTAEINGMAWDIADKYVLDCDGETSFDVEVTPKVNHVLVVDGQIVSDNKFEVEMLNPGTMVVKFIIKSTIDGTETEFKLSAEKYFAFEDLVRVKWNNTLLANNNSSTNGGYNFVNYTWYKDGQVISNKQYYSAGANKTDVLDANADYYVVLTTDKGETLRTCASHIALKSNMVKVYPSPVDANTTMYLETDLEDEVLSEANIIIYSMNGVRVRTMKAQDRITEIPAPAASGVYVVKFKSGSFERDIKFIVK